MQRVLSGVVAELPTQAEEQVNKKRAFEEPEDPRQFHGHYNDTAELELEQANKSRLFVNEICPKPSDENGDGTALHGVLVTLAALLGRQAAREILSSHPQKEDIDVDGKV
jgi:hypothetical protein